MLGPVEVETVDDAGTQLAADAGALIRFDREAQALAAEATLRKWARLCQFGLVWSARRR